MFETNIGKIMGFTRSFSEKEGIFVFDSSLDLRSSYDKNHLEILMKAEPYHFWFSARRDKICHKFLQRVDKTSRILEIGGGTGFVAESLMKMGYTVEMSDIHLNGLQYAKRRGIKKLYQFDLFSPPFHEEFDVICLFDVLEHLSEEQLALECISKMLKPGGKIILTVPAHQWLWSREDTIAGHKRRYTKKALEKILTESAFHPIQIQYFMITILPLLLLRRWIKKDSCIPIKSEEAPEIHLHPFLNRILLALTRTEFSFERFLPNIAGGSLLAIAQKQG